MHNVIQSKCACMDSDITDPNDEEGSLDEAEQDEVLFEYAGDILPSLGQALSDPEKFKTYFAGMLTHLVKKTKPRYATYRRFFSSNHRAILRSIHLSIFSTSLVDKATWGRKETEVEFMIHNPHCIAGVPRQKNHLLPAPWQNVWNPCMGNWNLLLGMSCLSSIN